MSLENVALATIPISSGLLNVSTASRRKSTARIFLN